MSSSARDGTPYSRPRARRRPGAPHGRRRQGAHPHRRRDAFSNACWRCLSPQCSRIIINANGDPARFADTGLAVVADSVPDFAGPLAGILAGLDWAAANAPDTRMARQRAGRLPVFAEGSGGAPARGARRCGTPLACARSGEWRHPVVGLWPVELREDLRHALVDEGLHKIELWTARHGVAIADWPDDADRSVLQRQHAGGCGARRSNRRAISGRVTALFALRRRQPGHGGAALRFKTLDLIEIFERDVDIVDAAHQPVLAQRADLERVRAAIRRDQRLIGQIDGDFGAGRSRNCRQIS